MVGRTVGSDFSPRFILHATNVHQGGGKSLLVALLAAIPPKVQALAQLDSRLNISQALTENLMVRYVKPSIKDRLQAELWLSLNARTQDIILCFGNLPPLLNVRGHVVVFVQNRYLIDKIKLHGLPPRVKVRISLERLWLSAKMRNVHELIVQTPSMKRLLGARSSASVTILPFMESHEDYARELPPSEMLQAKEFDFFYVASGESHKNHRRLIEAWCLLADEGFNPSLKLTLDRGKFPELCDWIERLAGQYRLNLENLENLPHKEIIELYARARALIYPSTFESFGLPLIEARQARLPILASEMDFVRDVVDPEETFDPNSAVSIARAVKRFMGWVEPPLPMQDAKGFLNHILERVE